MARSRPTHVVRDLSVGDAGCRKPMQYVSRWKRDLEAGGDDSSMLPCRPVTARLRPSMRLTAFEHEHSWQSGHGPIRALETARNAFRIPSAAAMT